MEESLANNFDGSRLQKLSTHLVAIASRASQARMKIREEQHMVVHVDIQRPMRLMRGVQATYKHKY